MSRSLQMSAAKLSGMVLFGLAVLSTSAHAMCEIQIINGQQVYVCDGGPPITSPSPQCDEVWVCQQLNTNCHYELVCHH